MDVGLAPEIGVKPAVDTPVTEVSAFAKSVFSLLDREEYRRCETGEDLEDIYRLRYRAYRLNDLVPENREGIVIDALDSAPNCYPFGIYIDGRLVSTIRLITSRPTCPSRLR